MQPRYNATMETPDVLVHEGVANDSPQPVTFHGIENDLRVVESQPSATHVSLHQRSLTPVFVDTQLSSTTTTATSPRQRVLTLHEYRKRQQHPSPPVGVASRRVRRKAATRDLTAIKRVEARAPPNPLPSPERLLESSPSPWPSERVHGPSTAGFDAFVGLRGEDSIPSFTSLLDSYRDRSSSAPAFSFNPSEQSKSIYSSETSSLVSKGRARYFKPSKRLPRPLTQPTPRFSHASITPSPLRLARFRRSNRLSSRLDTKILSPLAVSNLSFPHRPAPLHTTSSPDRQTPPSLTPVTQSPTEREEVEHFTVLKFGDVSFDVVNPHNSLGLKSIETSADPDADPNDSFEVVSEPAAAFRNHKRNNPSSRTMDSRQTFRTAHEDSSSTGMSGSQRLATPPRAMYEDLTAAHHAITSRNGLPASGKSSRLELPLPPRPVALSPHKSPKAHISTSSSNLSSYRPEPLNVQKMSRSSSVLRRVASIFRRNRYVDDEESKASTSGSHSVALLDVQSTSPPRRAPSIHLQWFQKDGQDKRSSRSAPYFCTADDQSFIYSGHHVRHSISQPEIRHSAYVSNYPDTEGGGSRIFDADSVAPEWSSPDLDYSREVFDQSRLWQFADKPDTEAQRMSLLREGTADSIVERYAQNDSTLDSIVGNYYKEAPPGSAPSLTTLSTAGEEYDNSPAIERGRSISNARRVGASNPRLSQFEFGLSQSHRTDGSLDDDYTQRPPRTGRLPSVHASTRGPPSGPLPPLPSLPSEELGPPNPPFSQRGVPAITEDDISYNSSYGDTRNLLLASSTSRQRDVIEESRLASILPEGLEIAARTTLPARPSQKQLSHKTLLDSERTNCDNPEDVTKAHHQQICSLEKDWEEESVHDGRRSNVSSLSGSVSVSQDKDSQALGANRDSSSGVLSDPFHHSQRLTETIPKMWQEASSFSLNRQAQTKISRHQPSSSTKTTTSDDPDEWETVADTSRADIANDETEDRGDNIFKFASESYPTLQQETAGFKHCRHHSRHEYPPKLNTSALMPSYDFRDGTGFPHHNALTPTRNATPRKHPRPLGNHAHPFDSPPPHFGLFNSPGATSMYERDVEAVDQDIRRQDNENGASENKIPQKTSSDKTRKQHPLSTTSTANGLKSPKPCVTKLRTELSSDFEYDPNWVPYASPAQKHTKLFTKTSLSTIPSSTRDASERMSSSTNYSTNTKTQRVNSFAKFTVTGPKTNLTGTPRGTGMREVGSSEADNSSPGMRFSSSPMSPKSGASLRLIHNEVQEQAELDKTRHDNSQSSSLDPVDVPRISNQKSCGSILSVANSRLTTPVESLSGDRQLGTDPISPCSRSSLDTNTGNRANEGRQRRYQHLRAPSKKWAPLYTKEQRSLINEASPPNPSRKSSRRSVYGQKELMPMRLGTISPIQDDHEEVAGSIQLTELTKASRGKMVSSQPTEVRPRCASAVGSTRTEAPLIGRPSRHTTICTRPSSVGTPSLKHIPPTLLQLAERRPREKMLSQIVFAICLVFPPALIMYGVGWMDPLMAILTKGELVSFGATEKRVARYMGITVTVAAIAAIVAFMIAHVVKF